MFGEAIVWYLFLGGGGGGMAALLSALDLLYWRRRAKGDARLAWTSELDAGFFARGFCTATVALAMGVLCLLVDTGRPDRFYYVLIHPTTSVLTFGSFSLSLVALSTAALAAISLFRLARVPAALVSALEACAIVSGLATAAYTGVFLSQMDFLPFWNNPLLAPLFLFSSASAGMAGALICLMVSGERSRLAAVRACGRADMLIVGIEAVLLLAYFAVAGAAHGLDAVAAFVLGEHAVAFWAGCVGLGLIAPVAFHIAASAGRPPLLAVAGAPCALVGGFFLRYCIVNAPFPLPI